MEEKIRTEKKLWSKPELIVLARSNPEEAVLLNCKATTSPQGSPKACKTSGQSCVANNAVVTS